MKKQLGNLPLSANVSSEHLPPLLLDLKLRLSDQSQQRPCFGLDYI